MITTAYPKCTHCEYQFDEEEMWYGEHDVGKVYIGDCDDSELKCPNEDCEKTFYVRCIHELRFIQVDSDGDEING